jgi:homoserine O-succinyltransferase/O-acetyltransferase
VDISDKQPFRIAVLDMYRGEANQGMRGILETISATAALLDRDFSVDIFDVRGADEMPDTGFDLYISSGGPGSPIDSEGSVWEEQFFGLMEALFDHNHTNPRNPKYIFLICHSFQVYCRHYGFGKVCLRKSMSFGVMPCHPTPAGLRDPLFGLLPEPYYVVDSREWQIVQPDMGNIYKRGAEILALEKIRPHVALERCIMAMRFSEYAVGVQFHPEADPEGMLVHILTPEIRDIIVRRHGEEKYRDIIAHLHDEDKILNTYNTLLPAFISKACGVAEPVALHHG